MHERAGELLSGTRLDHALLPQSLTNALDDRPLRLSVDNQRIDASADIIDRDVADKLQAAAFRIDLDFANRAAIRANRFMHLIVCRNGEPGRKVVGHGMTCHFLGELEKVEAAIAIAYRKAPVIELDPVG